MKAEKQGTYVTEEILDISILRCKSMKQLYLDIVGSKVEAYYIKSRKNEDDNSKQEHWFLTENSLVVVIAYPSSITFTSYKRAHIVKICRYYKQIKDNREQVWEPEKTGIAMLNGEEIEITVPNKYEDIRKKTYDEFIAKLTKKLD